jgi:two-component system response regulator FixJ
LAQRGLRIVELTTIERFFRDYPFVPARIPQCLLVDERMAGRIGAETQGQLSEYQPLLPSVMVTGTIDSLAARLAVRSGAVDLVGEPISESRLFEAVDAALKEDEPRRLVRMLTENLQSRFASLTERESQVLQCLLQGRSNKEIAYDFVVSIQTVARNAANALKKMGVRNIAELQRLVAAVPRVLPLGNVYARFRVDCPLSRLRSQTVDDERGVHSTAAKRVDASAPTGTLPNSSGVSQP